MLADLNNIDLFADRDTTLAVRMITSCMELHGARVCVEKICETRVRFFFSPDTNNRLGSILTEHYMGPYKPGARGSWSWDLSIPEVDEKIKLFFQQMLPSEIEWAHERAHKGYLVD